MQLGDFLGPVAAYCVRERYPQLTVLVVDETGVPGDKYPGGKNFYMEQSRVFAFEWLDKHVPTPDHFESAWLEIGPTLKGVGADL